MNLKKSVFKQFLILFFKKVKIIFILIGERIEEFSTKKRINIGFIKIFLKNPRKMLTKYVLYAKIGIVKVFFTTFENDFHNFHFNCIFQL